MIIEASSILEVRVNETTIRLQQDDLTAMAVDAIVYYAREDLRLGSGFGTAIQSRGGDAIRKELEKIGRIGMGEAVVTTGGNLKAGHVIHACGPKFQEPETERKLRECMLSALKAAHDKGLKRVAFPPMGAGFYGVPLGLCAEVMLGAIRQFLRQPTPLEEIIICVIDAREFAVFAEKLACMR